MASVMCNLTFRRAELHHTLWLKKGRNSTNAVDSYNLSTHFITRSSSHTGRKSSVDTAAHLCVFSCLSSPLKTQNQWITSSYCEASSNFMSYVCWVRAGVRHNLLGILNLLNSTQALEALTMWKCLKSAFLLLTCRGRLHWLQKEVSLYESQWQNDPTSDLP